MKTLALICGLAAAATIHAATAERFEDALQMVNRLNHPALGVTFNLCHWLKVEGSERDPTPLLKAALPRLNSSRSTAPTPATRRRWP